MRLTRRKRQRQMFGQKKDFETNRERETLTNVLTVVFGATSRRGHRDRDVKEMEEGKEEEEREEEYEE